MAKTITKTKTGLNWGSEGIDSSYTTIYPDASSFTDNSFTTKCVSSIIGHLSGSRCLYFYPKVICGSNGTLVSIKVKFNIRTDNDWSPHEVWMAMYQYPNNSGEWTQLTDKFVFDTTDRPVEFLINGSDLSFYHYVSKDSNGNITTDKTYDYYNIQFRNYATGKTSLFGSETANYYFSNVSFEATYTVPAYTLTVNAGTGGTVTGGGDYEAGTTATIKATPNTGYKFVKWVNASGTTVSTSVTYSLSVTADTTLTAVFEKLTYTITFKNEDGTILQASSVAYGDTPKYTGATPTKASTAEYSYSFSGWSPSIAAVTGAATYTAKFTATKRSYAITVSAGEGGTASGGNTYTYGSTVQISATAKEDWEFRGWSDGNTDNPRTITVTGAATYTAVFEEKAPLPEMLDFKIINPRNNMQVTIDNPLEVGQEYLIELTANQ